MCEFISFRIVPSEQGLSLKFAHSLNSHADIPEPGYEAEWTDDDDLSVRVPPDAPNSKADILCGWVRNNYKTRAKLIEYAIKSLDWSNNSLDLCGTDITSLPDNLSVGGDIDLFGTDITSLPDNLSVGGSLYLRGTGITSLPDNLSVGVSLYLRGTGIIDVPQHLQYKVER